MMVYGTGLLRLIIAFRGSRHTPHGMESGPEPGTPVTTNWTFLSAVYENNTGYDGKSGKISVYVNGSLQATLGSDYGFSSANFISPRCQSCLAILPCRDVQRTNGQCFCVRGGIVQQHDLEVGCRWKSRLSGSRTLHLRTLRIGCRGDADIPSSEEDSLIFQTH